MRKFAIILLPILLVSCGLPLKHAKSSNGTRQFTSSDSTFSKYITKFETDAKARYGTDFSVGDIPINFGDTGNDGYDGVCISYSDGTKEIIIEKDWWEDRGETSREMMIYHELGHCRLDRDHDDETIETDDHKIVKMSLMNSILPGPNHYILYKDGYLEELFKKTKQTLDKLVSN